MKFTAIILGLFVLSSIISCRLQTAPLETADVTGLVVLVSGMFLPTPSGVTVSLEGTNFSTVTDNSGKFEMKNVPSGTYTVRWSKPGYGDVRSIGAAIQGGGNTPIYIAQPDYEVVPGTITTTLRAFSHLAANIQSAFFSVSKYYNYSEDTCLVLDGSYTDDQFFGGYQDAITAFFSHQQDVSPLEGHYDGFMGESGPTNKLDGSTEPVFDTTNNTFNYVMIDGLGALRSLNFHSGDSVYVAVYGTVYPESVYGDYFDPKYNEGVITSYNQTPSRVIGLKIP